MQVEQDRDGLLLVTRIDEAIEVLGRLCANFEEADIINHDRICGENAGENAGHGIVGTMRAHQRTKVFQS